MKKIILKFSLSIILLIVLLIFYLSIIGVETKKFNSQIGNQIKKLNKDFDIELDQVKIILDLLNLKIDAKTIGPKIYFKDKIIDLEYLQTQISIKSLISEKFLLSNLEISTKALEIKNLIYFVRTLKKGPELYFLERFVKKGFVIADIKIEFDDKGEVKKNYSVIGFVRDVKINLFKKYKIDKFSFNFKLKDQNFDFKEIQISLNNIPFLSKKIFIKKIKDYFFIEGEVENKNVNVDKKNIDLFINPLTSNIDIKKINFNSKNKFSFKILKKLNIENFLFSSNIELKELIVTNNFKLKEIFPQIKKELNFKNHSININYNKKDLVINGNGKILLQDNEDKINYSIKKRDKDFKFSSLLSINNNQFLIDFLNYKKKNDSELNIKIDGSFSPRNKVIINNASLDERKNKIILNDLVLDKNFKIESLKSLSLDYLDSENKKNKFSISNKKKNYILKGETFNANRLIENLIEVNNKKKFNLFKKKVSIILDIDEVFLDKNHKVKELKGNFIIDNNEIFNAYLNAMFTKNKILKFTVNTNYEGKVTTLFLDNAEPIVKRYKFIKGYENGSLDFYSLTKGEFNQSTLKIYDFKLKELPVLTKLLTLASLQGIADTLSGEGIRFNEFEMNFENNKKLMSIKEIYAIGPAISILMDGYIEKDKLVSLRGTLVPATTLNKVIGSIPLLGKILVGSKSGEGVFGVSFKIKGPPKNLLTTVNPIKTLTPRFITRTLEKIKQN